MEKRDKLFLSNKLIGLKSLTQLNDSLLKSDRDLNYIFQFSDNCFHNKNIQQVN